jgi:hypothetical protein
MVAWNNQAEQVSNARLVLGSSNEMQPASIAGVHDRRNDKSRGLDRRCG